MDLKTQRNAAIGLALVCLAGAAVSMFYAVALSGTVALLHNQCETDKSGIKTKFEGQKSVLEGTAQAATRKLRESEAKAAAYKGTLRAGPTKGHEIYDHLGYATVQIARLGQPRHCHGVLAMFRGEVIILTARHCVVDRASNTKMDGEIKVSDYLSDLNHYMGYGFVEADPPAATFRSNQVVTGSDRDLAYIRGLPLFKSEEVVDRVLAVAPNPPDTDRTIFSTSWQGYCWQLDSSPCENGELLKPAVGISRGILPTAKNFYDYFLATYPGDSGSGILDDQGQLVGIVSAGVSDKTVPMATYACGPRSIRMFLESTWRK